MLTRRPNPARRGATLVEVALLMAIFLLFLFGVLEYCRYLLMLHATTNAARDGARWASVRISGTDLSTGTAVSGTQTTDPDFGSLPVFDVPAVTDYVQSRTGGTDRMIDGFTVRVFPCDPVSLAGNSTTAPTIQPKAQPDSPGGAVAWNNAKFSERIAVRVTGTYRPILPSFLWMGNTAAVKIAAVVGSEG